jgi:hypothetical protein
MQLFFLLSILFLSIQSQNNFREVSAQDLYGDVKTRMVGMKLQLKQADENYYLNVNHSSISLPEVQNNTKAIFVASFVNEEAESAELKSFNVLLYNSSINSVETQKLTLTYPTNNPTKKVIQTNAVYTEQFESELPFTILDDNFLIQYHFVYAFQSNLTNDFDLYSPFNFSIKSLSPPFSPPEFIIWAWWSINAVLVVLFSIGYYGNRKIKAQKLKK